jgi:hypothetical protein
MRNILSITVVLSILGTKMSYGQNVIANPKSNTIITKKTTATDLVLPIEVDFANLTAAAQNPDVVLQIDNRTAPIVLS